MPKASKEALERIAKWRRENHERVLLHKRRYYERHKAKHYAASYRRRKMNMTLKTEVYAREMLARRSCVSGRDIPDELVKAYAAYLKLLAEIKGG